MKGQPNRDSNPVPLSQETNHATNWANKAGYIYEWRQNSIKPVTITNLFLLYIFSRDEWVRRDVNISFAQVSVQQFGNQHSK